MEKLNDRYLTILKTIVERYIRDGQPVGSKALAEDNSVAIALSPATIRNIMADLEQAGYLQSPHTSAGRIPTAQGYRLFVNTLLTVQPLAAIEVQQIKENLRPETESTALAEKVSNLLSTLTQLAGIVSLPKREHFTFRQIEFLPLSDNRILAVIVFNDREIQNRIINCDRHFSASELQQAGNYLTQMFAGKDWLEIRHEVKQALSEDKQTMSTILQSMNTILEKAFSEEETKKFVLAGETNLLTLAEDAGIDRLRSLFETLNQKRTMLDLLDGCLQTNGVQIFIGEESGHKAFDNCSIIAAPYSAEGKIVGVLGVIGPTRIHYERVISAVDITAKLLSAALSE